MNYANVVFKFDMILQDVHYKNANDVFFYYIKIFVFNRNFHFKN